MAITQTEVYRRFGGQLSSSPLRCLAITSSGIRAATRKKIPLLLFFAPSAIGTIALSFLIYLQYDMSEGVEQGGLEGVLAKGMAQQLLAARRMIMLFNTNVWLFALLTIAWFGSGLLADDRKLGAHQLYFSRPITRTGYLFSKFLVAVFFGAMAMTVPVLIMCTVAAFSSPDWIYLKQDWQDIPTSLGFSLLAVSVLSLIVMAFSSLTHQRIFALAATFGLVMVTFGCGQVLVHLNQHDETWSLISLTGQFGAIRDWLFDRSGTERHPDIVLAWLVLGGEVLVCLLVLGWRARKLEEVA